MLCYELDSVLIVHSDEIQRIEVIMRGQNSLLLIVIIKRFYLEDCANTGRTPEKPLSGDLMLHIDPEMHGAVLAAAKAAGKSPDQWAAEVFAGAVGR